MGFIIQKAFIFPIFSLGITDLLTEEPVSWSWEQGELPRPLEANVAVSWGTDKGATSTVLPSVGGPQVSPG